MKKLNPTEARQGKEGKPVLIILLVSLAAAAVVWIGIEIFGNVIEPETPANSEQSVPPASSEQVPPASAN